MASRLGYVLRNGLEYLYVLGLPQQKRIIYTEEKRIKALKWAKVGDLWRVGRQYEKKSWNNTESGQHGIITQQSDSFMKKYFSVVGSRMKKELEGNPCIIFENQPPAKKNIGTTRSLR